MSTWEEFFKEYIETQDEIDVWNSSDAEWRYLVAEAKEAYKRYRKFYGIKLYEVWESPDDGENWYRISTFYTKREAQEYVRTLWYAQQTDEETLGYYSNAIQKIVES